MQLESYKQLTVWQRSIELVKEIYKVTDGFPKSELYGLVSQMRRASISIPSNIAEGYKRKNLGEYIYFLSIADASAAELETQLIISKDLYNDVDFSLALSLLEEVQKMLIVLIRKLNSKPSTLNPNSGFTALITVLMVSAISILTATTLVFLSTSESLFGFSAGLSYEAAQIADACVEEAFFRFKSNQNYSGGSIVLGDGACAIAVTGSGSTRNIIASSTLSTSIGNFTRRITATTTLVTNTAGNATTSDLTSWQE